jgi:hypothetical protein
MVGVPVHLGYIDAAPVREKNIKIAPRSATTVHTGRWRNTRELHKIFARARIFTWMPSMKITG